MDGTFGVYRVAFRLNGVATLLNKTNWTSSGVSWLDNATTGIQLVAEWEPDEFDTPVPKSTRIVIELSADNCDDAVKRASRIADTISRLMAFLAGAPHAAPRVVALLDTTPGISRRRYNQWSYDIVGMGPSRPLPVHQIESELITLGKRDDRERDAIVRAIKWYTDALKESDPVDKFLKLWVALESVGVIINRRAHKSGWSKCDQCQVEIADQEKDERQERGIRHAFSRVEGAPKDVFDRLKKVRNKLVHGEWSLDKVGAVVNSLVGFAVEATVKSILTALANPGAQPGSKGALLPSSEVQPTADVVLSAELPMPDENALGELSEAFNVRAIPESSYNEKDGYKLNAAFEIKCELPCEVENLKLTSERNLADSIQIAVDREPKFSHVERVRLPRK